VRIVAIDWSGAKRGAGRKIWAAEFRNNEPVPDLVTGKDRAEICDYLIKAARDTPKMVVGLDFAFSFPAWFVQTQASSVQQLWAKVDQEGEQWLTECKSPFWGRKNMPRCDLGNKAHYRRTEGRERIISGIRPKSVFQINGGGAVGTGSIRGMMMLHRLNAQFSIWPFDATWPRMIEIWPRALTEKVRKTDKDERKKYLASNYPKIPTGWRGAAEKSEDAFDAVVSACVMQKHKDALSSLKATSDPNIRLEGQIWFPPP
jgi:uncharacterized protein YbdZ (MbtH family)